MASNPPQNNSKGIVSVYNESGIDFYICLDNDAYTDVDAEVFKDTESFVLLKYGESILLETTGSDVVGCFTKVALIPSPKSAQLIGRRNPIYDVQVHTHEEDKTLKLPLIPKLYVMKVNYSSEPVVEWCMQNQRIRSSCTNVSAIDKGLDLLSSQTWSPSDKLLMRVNEENWLHPYLDGDVYEWTDMTGIIRMERDGVTLPDNRWIWANDWSVERSCGYGENVDADGWEYAKDFKSFGNKSRFYEEGDCCRRRRWTRTRLMKPPTLYDPHRPLAVVWRCSKDSNGNDIAKLTSPLTVRNFTQIELSLYGHSHSWNKDQFLGCVGTGDEFSIPVHLSCLTHLQLAVNNNDVVESNDLNYKVASEALNLSDYILAVPTNHKSEKIFHIPMNLERGISTKLDLPRIIHFTVKIVSESGCSQIIINPVLRVRNLLPSPLQFRLSEGNVDATNNAEDTESYYLEEQSLETGMESSSLAVDATLNPFVSFRVPGYCWSKSQRVVNRRFALSSWRPSWDDEKNQFPNDDSTTKTEEYTTIVHFERLCYGGDSLTLILEFIPGDCPLLQIFAQYWVVDKTGFGLRFCDGTGDLLGSTLNTDNPRRSYLLHNEMQNEPFLEDMDVDDHEWTIGKDGMTIFFSDEAKLAISIDVGDVESDIRRNREIQSEWSQLVDISNVIPKAVFSVVESNGDRRFDLSYDVTFAPSIFSKTKLVTIYNHFHLVNLSGCAFYVLQESSFDSTFVPPKGTVPFHWEDKSLENKVRFSIDERLWSSGTVQLDKVGIMALRLPYEGQDRAPMVIQTEVRLVKNDHDSAVVVLIWFANDQTNPLYVLRNKSSHEILCNQSCEKPSVDESVFFNSTGCGDLVVSHNTSSCNSNTPNLFDLVSNGLNCGMIEQQDSVTPDFTWHLVNGTSKYFGFDYPDKSHVLDWTCKELAFDKKSNRPTVDVDALGSTSVQILPSGNRVGCLVRAEDSTKVIEFFDVYDSHSFLDNLQDKLMHHKASLSQNEEIPPINVSNDEERLAWTVNVVGPGLYISIVDNLNMEEAGREIFLIHVDKTVLQASQTQDGYHELELRVLSLQIDNHIHKATHAVMVRKKIWIISVVCYFSKYFRIFLL